MKIIKDILGLNKEKSRHEIREAEFGKLYDLLQIEIKKYIELDARGLCFGLPHSDIDTSDFSEIPIFYKINDTWTKFYELPQELHIPMLSMMEKFQSQKQCELHDFNDLLNIDLDKVKKPEDIDQYLPDKCNSFDLDIDNKTFEIKFIINKLYNYELKINT